MLLFAEALFVLLVAVGVGLAYLPAGLIVAGVLGVLACERELGRRTAKASTGPAR